MFSLTLAVQRHIVMRTPGGRFQTVAQSAQHGTRNKCTAHNLPNTGGSAWCTARASVGAHHAPGDILCTYADGTLVHNARGTWVPLPKVGGVKVAR